MTIIITKCENVDDEFDFKIVNDETKKSAWLLRCNDGWEVFVNVQHEHTSESFLESVSFCSDLDDALMEAEMVTDRE